MNAPCREVGRYLYCFLATLGRNHVRITNPLPRVAVADARFAIRGSSQNLEKTRERGSGEAIVGPTSPTLNGRPTPLRGKARERAYNRGRPPHALYFDPV